MQGRVVRQLGITVPGAERASLLTDQRYASGLLLPVETGVRAGEAAVLDLQTLQQAVTSWLRDNDVPPAMWGNVQIDVSFFHPDTKAVSVTRREGADYDHSPWFDGVAARTDAAFSQSSLVGSFFFGLDGVIPAAYDTALGAIKKLTFALQQVTLMPESRRRALTGQGLTDMSGMLDALTDFAMLQRIDGREPRVHGGAAFGVYRGKRAGQHQSPLLHQRLNPFKVTRAGRRACGGAVGHVGTDDGVEHGFSLRRAESPSRAHRSA